MSGAIGFSSYGSLDQILASTSSLRNQYTTLEEQTATGLVSQNYAGLASVSSQVMDLTAAINQGTAYTQSITQAQGKASSMQDVLSQIGTIVSNMSASAVAVSASTPGSTVTAMAQQATDDLSQIASLLNTTYAGDYIFSGADTANPPIPSPDSITSSGMFTQIGAQVSALATVPTTPPVATVIANTVSIAASTAAGTTIFSSYLTGAGATSGSTAPVQVQIGPSQSVTLDLPANQNVGAVSDPSINGTGDAISDIMRSLAVVANSTSGMVSNPDFSTLMQNVSQTLTSAGTTLSQESGYIGISQDAMTAAANSQSSMQTVLQTQLTGLTDVDMPTAISNLQAVSNQLQTSYTLLGEVSSLNLAKYL
jgi:flagellin-like hook-associated protein FlgL